MHLNIYADTVGDVFDRYDNSKSVKAYERANRTSKLDSIKPYQVIDGRTAPPWDKFIANSDNKMSFNNFLAQKLEALLPQKLSGYLQRSYFLAGAYADGKVVKVITCEGSREVAEQFTSQEEADTRMLLHNVCASANIRARVIVRSRTLMFLHYAQLLILL